MKEFTCSYGYKGKQWCFSIHAESWDDADARMAALKAWGKIDGEVKGTAPGWWPIWAVKALMYFKMLVGK